MVAVALALLQVFGCLFLALICVLCKGISNLIKRSEYSRSIPKVETKQYYCILPEDEPEGEPEEDACEENEVSLPLIKN